MQMQCTSAGSSKGTVNKCDHKFRVWQAGNCSIVVLEQTIKPLILTGYSDLCLQSETEAVVSGPWLGLANGKLKCSKLCI